MVEAIKTHAKDPIRRDLQRSGLRRADIDVYADLRGVSDRDAIVELLTLGVTGNDIVRWRPSGLFSKVTRAAKATSFFEDLISARAPEE